MKKRLRPILISIGTIILLINLISIFGLDLNQSIIMSGLLITIICWTSNIVNKAYASLFLLALFVIFGRTPTYEIFSFAISDTFLMIVFSYLFSQGVSNSGLTKKLLEPILFKYADNFIKLILIIFILQFTMIFVIPQPFSRIIILAIIINEYFERIKLEEKTKEAVMFWLHASSVFINMTFIRGDIILNNALLNIADISINESTWMSYMFVPSLIFYAISVLGFVIVFRKELNKYNDCEKGEEPKKEELTSKEKRNLVLISAVVLLWATEYIHGISGCITVIGGTVLMFIFDMLEIKDLKVVDIGLLIFLTATFSIGKVMTYSGISDAIFSKFVAIFPDKFNLITVMVIATSIGLHMILGSNITTLSVVVPGLLLISSGIVDPLVIIFLIYISVCAHFALPFHQVIVLIGNGNNLYPSKTVIKYAPMLTIIVFISILLVYKTWWQIFVGVSF